MNKETKDLITMQTAAELRGISRQGIFNLIKRGKLSVVEIDGVKFLNRNEVENYEKEKGGRPKKGEK
ncbi:MAG: hypothetical protein M3033_01310 [Acidobacteriota bacterium]|nr:hypothetical protein [Acidobacteriota bacterium]